MTRILRAADQLKNPLLTILVAAILISYVRVNELDRSRGGTLRIGLLATLATTWHYRRAVRGQAPQFGALLRRGTRRNRRCWQRWQ